MSHSQPGEPRPCSERPLREALKAVAVALKQGEAPLKSRRERTHVCTTSSPEATEIAPKETP